MTRVLALLLTSVLALVAGCSDEGGAAAKPSASPTPSGTSDEPAAASPQPVLAPSVAVGGGPVGLTATKDGEMWVVAAQGETVQRIPAGATATDLTVDVPGVPLRATAAFGSVWVTSFHGRRLVRLDPGTGEVTATVRTGEGPEGVASGFGSVWVVVQDAGRLLRVDPESAEVTADTEIGVGARLVAAGPDAMYVAHYADDTVLRVDPRGGQVTATSAAICDGPQGLAVLDGTVWVACTLSEELVGLDASTLAPVSRVTVPGSPDPVAATSDGRLAVVAQEGPRLVVVDPGTTTVVAEQVLGEELGLYDQANLDLVLSGGEAWVSSFDADRVYHLPLPR